MSCGGGRLKKNNVSLNCKTMDGALSYMNRFQVLVPTTIRMAWRERCAICSIDLA
jgi:hypothetical protein